MEQKQEDAGEMEGEGLAVSLAVSRQHPRTLDLVPAQHQAGGNREAPGGNFLEPSGTLHMGDPHKGRQTARNKTISSGPKHPKPKILPPHSVLQQLALPLTAASLFHFILDK